MTARRATARPTWFPASCHPLREERARRGLSLIALSALCRPRVCKSDISMYERGERTPGPMQALGISRGLGIPLATLLSWFPGSEAPPLRLHADQVTALDQLLVYAEGAGAMPEQVAVLRQAMGASR